MQKIGHYGISTKWLYYAFKIRMVYMKRTLVILCVIILLLSGCGNKSQSGLDSNIETSETDVNSSTTIVTKKSTDDIENQKSTSQKGIVKEKEGITVKRHNISKFLNGYPYWYANKNAEKVLNIINRKDRKALKEMISPSSKAESDIDKQMNTLFEYVDGSFIDYEEDLPGEDEYVSYGNKLKQSYSITVLAKTDKSEYYVDINFVLKDEDKKDNVGIEYIIVTKKEIMDYYLDNYDSQSQPNPPDKGGIWCMGKDGVML